MAQICIGELKINQCDWTDDGHGLLEDENLRFVVDEFLLRSPSMGESALSTGFIKEQRVMFSALAEELTERLLGDVEHVFFESSSELVSHVAPKIVLCNRPWNLGEFVYQTVGDSTDLDEEFKNLAEIKDGVTGGLAEGAQKRVKKRYREVNSIYRHLRNALAHGCFKRVDISGVAGLFYYDLNDEKKLSAIAAVTFERLGRWRTVRYQTING